MEHSLALGRPAAGILGKRRLLFWFAVAALFALTVVEPMMVGIAGAGHAHLRLADGRHTVIDGYTTAPETARPDLYRPRSDSWPDYMEVEGRENTLGVKSVGVPGTLAAWCEMLARFGTLPLPVVMAPAIRHAEQVETERRHVDRSQRPGESDRAGPGRNDGRERIERVQRAMRRAADVRLAPGHFELAAGTSRQPEIAARIVVERARGCRVPPRWVLMLRLVLPKGSLERQLREPGRLRRPRLGEAREDHDPGTGCGAAHVGERLEPVHGSGHDHVEKDEIASDQPVLQRFGQRGKRIQHRRPHCGAKG